MTDRTQKILDVVASAVVAIGTIIVLLPLALLGGDVSGLTFDFDSSVQLSKRVKSPARSAQRAARSNSKR